MEPSADALTLTTTILLLLTARTLISLFGYSGESSPPMYGDFEAQRHWMEIAVNLPPTSWYVNGPDNDLLYWGLDYPPLSAHLAWLLGCTARIFGHAKLVALHASRGHESPETRAFMRHTVLACDALVFLTAAAAYSKAATSSSTRRIALLLQISLVPALLLVDHGHFQYNCVSLGLTLWASHFCLTNRPLLCCAAFSLALNFKQMCLYLAPAFFCHLLAGCIRRHDTLFAKAVAVLRLGSVVIATFLVCWLPFLGSTADALAVIRRIFPVERHLYEDKVANIWCTLSLIPFLKLKQSLPIPTLVRLALGTTLLALLPPCAILLYKPSRSRFLLCGISCGLAFFLCSFQVHEKHILLPLLPASLLAHKQPTFFAWFATISAFSLYPLLKRDGLSLPYAIGQMGFLALLRTPLLMGGTKEESVALPLPRLASYAMGLSLVGMLALHGLELLVTPPARYPDLHSVLFAAYSCGHFCAAYLAAIAVMVVGARHRNATVFLHTPMDGKMKRHFAFEGLEHEGSSEKRR